MEKIIKDILSIEESGKKVGKLVKKNCPICGAEVYELDGESFCMCDCDKFSPAEYCNV